VAEPGRDHMDRDAGQQQGRGVDVAQVVQPEALRRAELPRPVARVTGRVRCPPYHPAAAPVREDQAVRHAPDATSPEKRHRGGGRNAAHCPSWPLQPQQCFASRKRDAPTARC
jgi:hypothetical protein